MHALVHAVLQVPWQVVLHCMEQAAAQLVLQLAVPPSAGSARSDANPKTPHADNSPLPRVLRAARRSICRSSSRVCCLWLVAPSYTAILLSLALPCRPGPVTRTPWPCNPCSLIDQTIKLSGG
jgi:hypothetical protein